MFSKFFKKVSGKEVTNAAPYTVTFNAPGNFDTSNAFGKSTIYTSGKGQDGTTIPGNAYYNYVAGNAYYNYVAGNAYYNYVAGSAYYNYVAAYTYSTYVPAAIYTNYVAAYTYNSAVPAQAYYNYSPAYTYTNPPVEDYVLAYAWYPQYNAMYGNYGYYYSYWQLNYIPGNSVYVPASYPYAGTNPAYNISVYVPASYPYAAYVPAYSYNTYVPAQYPYAGTNNPSYPYAGTNAAQYPYAGTNPASYPYAGTNPTTYTTGTNTTFGNFVTFNGGYGVPATALSNTKLPFSYSTSQIPVTVPAGGYVTITVKFINT